LKIRIMYCFDALQAGPTNHDGVWTVAL